MRCAAHSYIIIFTLGIKWPAYVLALSRYSALSQVTSEDGEDGQNYLSTGSAIPGRGNIPKLRYNIAIS